jgi:hypothetical protein
VSFIAMTTIGGGAGAAVCVGAADATGVAEDVAVAGVDAVALGVVEPPPSLLPPPHAKTKSPVAASEPAANQRVTFFMNACLTIDARP